jgi:hypothetical protein
LFEREAHGLFATVETSPSRVMSLFETRKQLGILNLKQSDLLLEALVAAETSLFRPAMVMSWAAFMDFLQEKIASDKLVRLHAEYPAWSKHKNLDELRENVTEFQLLDAAKKLGLLTKAETKALHGLLSKRNECAHPSGYTPGINEALGYISELLNRIPTIDQRSL